MGFEWHEAWCFQQNIFHEGQRDCPREVRRLLRISPLGMHTYHQKHELSGSNQVWHVTKERAGRP